MSLVQPCHSSSLCHDPSSLRKQQLTRAEKVTSDTIHLTKQKSPRKVPADLFPSIKIHHSRQIRHLGRTEGEDMYQHGTEERNMRSRFPTTMLKEASRFPWDNVHFATRQTEYDFLEYDRSATLSGFLFLDLLP
jgi:hypothetical protein